MTFDALRGRIPDYAKDIKLNLSSVLGEDSLTPQQRGGCVLACALAGRHADVIRAAEAYAADILAPEALQAAKAAAAIMAMNNVYYRFVHLASNGEYANLPAKLRMKVIGEPGVEKADFELWSLAVSAVNGCGLCIDSHEQVLRKAGVRSEQIQAAVRIASVIHALALTLEGEEALKA